MRDGSERGGEFHPKVTVSYINTAIAQCDADATKMAGQTDGRRDTKPLLYAFRYGRSQRN